MGMLFVSTWVVYDPFSMQVGTRRKEAVFQHDLFDFTEEKVTPYFAPVERLIELVEKTLK
jgi:hypothetical protein